MFSILKNLNVFGYVGFSHLSQILEDFSKDFWEFFLESILMHFMLKDFSENFLNRKNIEPD